MKTYKTVKESAISNRIIAELNASVLSATFSSKEGLQWADLYNNVNSGKCVVSHNTCAPVNSQYIETILITF